MRRVLLAVTALALGLAFAPTAAEAQLPSCSGPAPAVAVRRFSGNGAIRVDAAAGGWTCTGGVTPTLQLRVAPTNLLAALLVPGSTGSGSGQGSASAWAEVPASLQAILLLRPPACFTATLTVAGGGALRTATGQGCG